MWSVRPFKPRCAVVPGERAAETMAARLAAAAARYQPDLPHKQALEIVQKLHNYAVQFKLFPKEKL